MATLLAQSFAAGLDYEELHEPLDDHSGPPSEAGERRWDEGLSKEERLEAKRKYKNRRSAERWRRRKKEEKARAKAEADGSELSDLEELPDEGDDAAPQLPGVAPARLEGECELATAAQDTARNMLYEHSKLGKVAESDFMCQLQQLTAYSIVPGGFQQYKEEILLIAEKAVDVLQCEGPPQLKAARRYAASGLKFHPEWFSPTTANFGQVCATFLQGREGHVKVPLTICAKPAARFSLRQLAMLPVPIQMEVYFRGVAQIRQLLPLAMQGGSSAGAVAEARGQIGHKLREVMTILSAYIMGNPSAFTITRTVRPPEQPPIAKLMSAAAAMGLSMETCRQLWGAWDAMVQQLPPLLAVQQAQERGIEEILSLMDHSSDAPYVLLLAKVRELLATYRRLMELSVVTELRCTMEILTPFQCALLHAAYAPHMTAHDAHLKNVDPVLRMATVFQQGLIPYRMP